MTQKTHFKTVSKLLKDEGIALCNGGKLKDGEAKLREAFNIISLTRMN